MPAVPRTIMPAFATRPEGMLASSVVTQRGSVQTRDMEAMGVGWQETYRNLRAGNADVEALLSFLRRHARKGTFLWADHPDVPGMGRASGGAGEENLIRDAAMDADADLNGVVDGFGTRVNGPGFTFSLNGTEGAQEITSDGTGANGNSALVEQFILRVFPGDEITMSVAGRLTNTSTDIRAEVHVRWLTEANTAFGVTGGAVSFTKTSYTRRAITATAPADIVMAKVFFVNRLTANGGSGDVRFRDARLLRASSDPATWANPHVNGASQTGSSLATAGWPAGTTNVVRDGDTIRLGGSAETKAAAETDEMIRIFEVAADADSDGSGLATLEIDPPILSGNTPPDGAALRLSGSRARVIIPSYTMPEASPGNILAQVRARYREAV